MSAMKTNSIKSRSKKVTAPKKRRTPITPTLVKQEAFQFTKEQSDNVRLAFDLVDINKTGKIKMKDLNNAVSRLGYYIGEEQIRMLLPKDVQEIDFDQFCNIAAAKIAEKRQIHSLFELFDDEEKGKISWHDMRRVAKNLSLKLKDEDFIDLISELDHDADGHLTEKDISKLYSMLL